MRATLNLDPVAGSGYGVIAIEGLGDGEWETPKVIITRLSDGKILSSGGWGEEAAELAPNRVNPLPNGFGLCFGPNIINDLSSDERYELEIPGLGKAPLWIAGLDKSRVVAPDSLDRINEGAAFGASVGNVVDRRVYEGVAPTPEEFSENIPGGDSGPEPTGVISSNEVPPPKKRFGCALLASLLAIVWLAGGFVLWRMALDAPQKDREEESGFIELMPRAEGS